MQLEPTSAQESAMAPPAAMSTSTPDANDPPTGEILSFSYSHQAYHRSLILFFFGHVSLSPLFPARFLVHSLILLKRKQVFFHSYLL